MESLQHGLVPQPTDLTHELVLTGVVVGKLVQLDLVHAELITLNPSMAKSNTSLPSSSPSQKQLDLLGCRETNEMTRNLIKNYPQILILSLCNFRCLNLTVHNRI